MVSKFASPRSASAKTIAGFLPPISSETFLNDFAAVLAIVAPVRVEPVNDTALIRGCCTIALPTDGPVPCTMLRDRKSTRLNSSHPSISYAVFCLKKKKYTKKVHTDMLNDET